MLSDLRRLILISALALVAFAAVAAIAVSASTPRPVITSASPKQAAVGDMLVIHGENFEKGVTKNRVVFVRASDGKAVRVRPSKANSTRRLDVVVQKAIAPFLDRVRSGVAVATRFRIQVISGKFSRQLAASKSPVIWPTNAANPTTPSTGTPAPAPDCTPDEQGSDAPPPDTPLGAQAKPARCQPTPVAPASSTK